MPAPSEFFHSSRGFSKEPPGHLVWIVLSDGQIQSEARMRDGGVSSAKRSAEAPTQNGGLSEEQAATGPYLDHAHSMVAASFRNAANLTRGLAQFKIAPLQRFC